MKFNSVPETRGNVLEAQMSEINRGARIRALENGMPLTRHAVASWAFKTAAEVEGSESVLHPSLRSFQSLVNGNPKLKKLADDMFIEASTHYPEDPAGNYAIRDFEQFLHSLNIIITSGPEWYNIQQPDTAMGMIGFPINTLLNWPMGTTSGYKFWLLPQVNEQMGKILKTWGKLLASPASTSCLNKQNGWLSPVARELLAAKANDGITKYSFEQLFVCDTEAPHYGFDSWDDFFVREFRDEIRPVEAPDNEPTNERWPDPTLCINNACESAPLNVRKGVELWDSFFLKGQPYSLLNMLDMNHSMARQFVGGTVYQAYLSALSYHRWHAPVSGTVKSIEVVPGTYYSQNWFKGLSGAHRPDRPDAAAPNSSQPYLSAVATRGIIYIEAANPKIGLMAIIFIGMAEVSSCEFTVAAGQTVQKGQQIGMFHFGGSSYCMLFRPSVDLGFVHPPPWNMDTEENFRVNSVLAAAS